MLDKEVSSQNSGLEALQKLLVTLINEQNNPQPSEGLFEFAKNLARKVGIMDSVDSVTEEISLLQSKQRATQQALINLDSEFAEGKIPVLARMDKSMLPILKNDLQSQLNGLIKLIDKEKIGNLKTILSLQKQISALDNEILNEKSKSNILVTRFDSIDGLFEFEAAIRAMPKRSAILDTIPSISNPQSDENDEEAELSKSASI